MACKIEISAAVASALSNRCEAAPSRERGAKQKIEAPSRERKGPALSWECRAGAIRTAPALAMDACRCKAHGCDAQRGRIRKLEGALQCQLCHALPAAPVALTGCGHIFCALCIRRYLRGISACPFSGCKAPATTRDLLPLRRLDCFEGADGSFVEKPRLPQLSDASASLLRERLGKAMLSTKGDVERLRGRYQEYVMAYNVALDGGRGPERLRVDVLEAVREWDKKQDKIDKAKQAQALQKKLKMNGIATILTGTKRTLDVDGVREMTLDVVDDGAPSVDPGDSHDILVQKLDARFPACARKRAKLKAPGDSGGDEISRTAAGNSATPADNDENAGPASCGAPISNAGFTDENIVVVLEDEEEALECVLSPPELPILSEDCVNGETDVARPDAGNVSTEENVDEVVEVVTASPTSVAKQPAVLPLRASSPYFEKAPRIVEVDARPDKANDGIGDISTAGVSAAVAAVAPPLNDALVLSAAPPLDMASPFALPPPDFVSSHAAPPWNISSAKCATSPSDFTRPARAGLDSTPPLASESSHVQKVHSACPRFPAVSTSSALKEPPLRGQQHASPVPMMDFTPTDLPLTDTKLPLKAVPPVDSSPRAHCTPPEDDAVSAVPASADVTPAAHTPSTPSTLRSPEEIAARADRARMKLNIARRKRAAEARLCERRAAYAATPSSRR